MIEINNQTKNTIDEKLLKNIVEKFLKHHKRSKKTVSIVLVGDALIRKLNKQYRNKDQVTDVLSFNGSEDFLGEILIDYSQIKRQSKKFSANVNEELVFILIHGLLHLVGYSDETEAGAEEMNKLGRNFLKI